jgi:hypothetical protein
MQHMISKRAPVRRPQPDEYASFFEKYVSLIQSGDIVGTLEAQRVQMVQLLGARSEREGNFRYAPGKWSVKEIIGHLSDAERIFSYRALRIARGDETPLPGFEQDDYIVTGRFNDRTLADLAAEFLSVRMATITMVQSFTEEAWNRRGTASDHPVTVRAMAYVIAGHEMHHRKILDERYFTAIPRA